MPQTQAGRLATERRRFLAQQQLINWTCSQSKWALYKTYVERVMNRGEVPQTFEEWASNDG